MQRGALNSRTDALAVWRLSRPDLDVRAAFQNATRCGGFCLRFCVDIARSVARLALKTRVWAHGVHLVGFTRSRWLVKMCLNRDGWFEVKTRYRPGGGEMICMPPADGSSAVAKIAADLPIYVRPRTDPQSAHLWWPAAAKLQAASVPSLYRQLRHGTDIRTDRAIPRCLPRAGV